MANPIIQRELIGTLRSYRTVIALGLLSLVFTLLVAIRYPTEPRMALSGARSQEVFKLFMFGLLGALLLLLPVFPATSLVKERNRGTLGLLLNTLLGPWRIFLGKLTASFSLAVLMLFVSLPAATACFALGGVDPTTGLGGCYLVLLLTALELCAIALFMSSTATSSDAAIRTTYGIVLSLSLITLLPHTLFVGNGGPIEMAADWLRCLSPVSAITSLLGGADAASHGLSSSSNVPLRFALLSIAVTVICSVWTTSRLNFTLFDRVRSPGTIVDDQSTKVRFLRRLMFIVDPGRRSRAMSSFVNPVMVKEFRCRKFGRLHWLMRLVSVCAIISVGLAFVTATRTVAWDVGMIGGIMVILQVALIVLLTPSLTAGLICTERESGGWVLLQMSPMSIPSILWGKLLSVFLTLGLLLFATLPGYIVMVWIDPGQRPQIERVVICLLVTAVFATLSSAAIGSLFRYTATATAAAYSFLIAVCTLPLLVWMGRGAPFGQDTVEMALMINPIAAALSVIRFPGFEQYTLIPGHWILVGIVSVISVLVLFFQTLRLSRPQ